MKKYIAIGLIITSSVLYYFLFSDTDEIAPTFSNLPSDQVIEYGSIVDFNDLGLTAIDETDGDISNKIRNDIGNPRNLDLGSYVITYTVSDLSGNETTTSINLTVVDTTAPLVVVNTEDIQSTFEVGSTEIDLFDYIEVTDNYDNEFIEENITFSLENFDVDTIGTYQIPVNYTDSEGNVALETSIEIKLVHEWTSLQYLHYTEINDGTEIKIDYYSSYIPIDMYIPYYIDGLPVTEIGESAFDGFYTRINSVEIPDTVKTIGKKAFINNNLTSLIIPGSLEYIGVDAFSGNSLSELIIPNTVIEIQDRAFINNNLTSLVIPGSVEYIGDEAFRNNQLTELTFLEGGITLDEYAFAFNQLEIVIFHDGETIINQSAFENNQIVTLVLPEGLKEIESQTFFQNSIEELVIPSTVTRIGDAAFTSNNISSLTIPSSVETIEGYAFADNRIIDLTLSEGLISIGTSAFDNNLITEIIIPNTVAEIGNSAFSNNQIVHVTLPNNITIIPHSLFSNNNITSITIPESVTTLGDFAFNNNNITSVYIPSGILVYGIAVFSNNEIQTYIVSEDNEILTSIDNVLFSKDSTILIAYPSGLVVSEYVVPSNVLYIASSAFFGADIDVLTIQEGIKDLQPYIFSQSNITTLNLPESLTIIYHFAFENTNIITCNIPENVDSISVYSFVSNTIGEFTVSPNNNSYIAIDGVLFSDDGTELIAFPGGDNRESYIITEDVVSISFWAFRNSQLTSIIILGDEYRFNNTWSSIGLPDELMPIEPTD